MKLPAPLLLLLLLASIVTARSMPLPASPELDSLLLVASLEGMEGEVTRLLAAGANPDAVRDDEWTALMLAAMNGYTPIVRQLLDAGATIDLGSAAEGTPLCVAAMSPIDPADGSAAVVQLLLDRGADRNRGNGDGMTPLIYAAREGKIEVVRALIRAGAEVDRTDARMWTPLRFAARGGDTATLAALLAARANPNVREYDAPLTPLDHAVAGGSPAAVAMLLRGGADPNGFPVANGYSPSPLIRAAQTGSAEIARLLVAARANPNLVVSNDEGDGLVTALDIAIEAKERPMIALLKNAGARDKVDALYNSLLLAISKNDLPAVKRLLALGLDPRIEITRGDSVVRVLDEGVASGNVGIVAALLDFEYPFEASVLFDAFGRAGRVEGSGIVELMLSRVSARLAPLAAEQDDTWLLREALDRSDSLIAQRVDGGETLLHIAAYHGSRESVALLLQRGAPIVRDSWSLRTPIYSAVVGGDSEIVSMLISAGDSVNRQDRTLWTPLHLAAHAKRPEIISLLVASGATIDSRDEHGWQPLHTAARSGNPATVAKLIELGADPAARTLQNQTALDIARAANPHTPLPSLVPK